MSTLFNAVNRNGMTLTENGMATPTSSGSHVLDLFYKIGASRGNFDSLKPTLLAALAENLDSAIRVLLWSRDVREGAGERQIFRDAIAFIAEENVLTLEQARRILDITPILGRWDDVFAFIDTPLENEMFLKLNTAIVIGNDSLAAKWTPRKGPIAHKYRRFMGLSPKAYRKHLVSHTNVVENAMCKKEWSTINFSHVPSMAASRYQAAFYKNAPDAYAQYRDALVKGDDPKVKINAGAIYPYNIVSSVLNGDAVVADAQWKALPDYMNGSEYANILPVVDVSGSMSHRLTSSVTCMDVAISLGLYISERNKGIFKDKFVTFSENPTFVEVSGSLKNRVTQARKADWGYNTNLLKTFDVLLSAAIRAELPADEMPNTILIISDMQFDVAVGNYGRANVSNNTAMEAITQKYRSSGYTRPNIVFWNCRASSGVPEKSTKAGVALVSGFSPSIMKSILGSSTMTPVAVMEETIMTDRYNW